MIHEDRMRRGAPINGRIDLPWVHSRTICDQDGSRSKRGGRRHLKSRLRLPLKCKEGKPGKEGLGGRHGSGPIGRLVQP